MNFLEIAQRLRRESGLTSSLSTSPTTVVSQSGQLKDIVDWAAGAYTDLQTVSPCWRWLRSSFSLQTVSGTDTYAYGTAIDDTTAVAINRFARWWPTDDDCSNVKCYLTSGGVAGEYYLDFLPWGWFRDLYKRGPQTNNPPIHFTISPLNEIVLGPKPNDIFTVSGEYQKSAQVLALDADTPEMPADYHMLVVWNALLDYAGKSAAPEVFTRAQTRAMPLMNALKMDQLPQIGFAGALA